MVFLDGKITDFAGNISVIQAADRLAADIMSGRILAPIDDIDKWR